MSQSMKPNAFILSAAMAGLLAVQAVLAPNAWSDEQPAPQATTPNAPHKPAQAEGMQHPGMDHSTMKGMDHGSMKGMDHSKMMGSQGADKAKEGHDGH
ncbi:hypothetical protein [Pseudomonas sp. UFMG81]|uniref:hypothetical protein n=1 Tax=Pseudomonas sp. UFMG81 TaxID=2745936 RepID=UPI001E382FDA|nr:hypothetical protein [Pseudomonas sp. UFMG81]